MPRVLYRPAEHFFGDLILRGGALEIGLSSLNLSGLVTPLCANEHCTMIAAAAAAVGIYIINNNARSSSQSYLT